MGYNDDFVEKLTPQQRIGFVAHEVMHCVFQHMLRRGGRSPMKFNVACDYAINNLLTAESFTLPPEALIDAKYNDMTAEHIYSLLPDLKTFLKGLGKGDMADPGGCGEVRDMPGQGSNEGTTDDPRIEWDIAVAEAAQVAKMAGKLSAGMERFAQDITKAQVDWRTRLRRFFTATSARSDTTWNRPNRRFIAEGLYLPSTFGVKMGPIVIGIDTSGSIGSAELNAFASELSGLIDETDPEKVHVLYCDADVAGVQEFTKQDMPLKLEPKGGGGTRFSPVFQYIKDHDLRPKIAVYLTDMCCGDFGEDPGYPVLWVSTTATDTAPFGEVTQIKVGQ